MSKYGGKVAAGTFLFIFVLSFTSYYWKKNTTEYDSRKNKQPKLHDCFHRDQLTGDTITRLKDNYSFIINPYFDNRTRTVIRVISIIHFEKVKGLYCVFCCQNDSDFPIVTAEIDIHADRFGFPYGTADVLCLEPQNCSPKYMSIHPSRDPDFAQLPVFEIKNRHSGEPLLDFTVCISTMFGGFNNVLQFVQSVEMYKILGAQKVVVYKNKCSLLMERVLEHYVSEGMVEIIQWPIDTYLKPSTHWHHSMDPQEIGYYGQIAALNDCIYRNMYRSNYVLLIDTDEIILPLKDADWKSLMERLEGDHPGAGVFLFENHVFRNSVFAATVPFNFSSWRNVPGVNIFQHTFREPNKKGAFNNRKMVVRPEKVVQTSVHSVLKKYEAESVSVSSDVAILHHCRRTERVDVPKEALIQDPVIWKYNASLIANVDRVLHECNCL
ncbi:glycosyltransferase family 92 protein F13G3.3 [Anolis carolinensis]|uniref:Glycosyltransferase family 92 protein n=1 Tax=Anolis carolinensis TaxID=28377 RepID=H9GW29_ANOCA|nr:PREDICTED: glycosyltransferase family 92 protein F13G3.3 [Anolis carolinensis]XP_016852975.1 PREDICTED: glycosyltransferase family 92 protein F13G3.3 [Anolis carolinensis]|eukprot:XP_008119038.1 PREDICTED: glycosyltransferase family 92 protein F13G3.3 [Anolis carolinensis]